MNMMMAAFSDQRRIMGQEIPNAAQLLQQAQQNQQLLQQAAGPQPNLNQMIQQQAATLQQTQDTLSRLWWQENWPLMAAGVGALGVVGYLVFKKK